jgi:calcineurin-like phosphoesterase family protein
MNNTPFYQKFESSNTFVTGCIHLNHKNIVKGETSWNHGYRNFNTRQEMNSLLIDNINKIVPKDGSFFILGDMFFGDKKLIPEFMNQINCKNIYYIYGNHCEFLRKHTEYHYLFKWLGDYTEIFCNNRRICMSHYPAQVWNESHKGSFYLHSHCHSSLPDNINSMSLEVGADCMYGIEKDRENAVFTKCSSTGEKACYNYGNNPSNPELYFRNVDFDNFRVLHSPFIPFSMDDISHLLTTYKTWNQLDHHDKETN